MPIPVDCPHCGQRIMVSENTFGQTLKCPFCAQTFVIQTQAVATSPTHHAGENSAIPPIITERSSPSYSIKHRVAGPARGLIVTGAATTLMGLPFLPMLLFPELMGEQMPRDPVEMALSVLFMMLTLAAGIVTLYGALKMHRLESYPAALTAAITAMLPCYCCLLGLPIGIWALVILREPAVKAAFHRR